MCAHMESKHRYVEGGAYECGEHRYRRIKEANDGGLSWKSRQKVDRQQRTKDVAEGRGNFRATFYSPHYRKTQAHDKIILSWA